MAGIHSENKQQTTQQKSAANANAATGISMPAIPILQQKEKEEEHETIQKTSSDKIGGQQLKSNHTGMPDNLKSGIENLSGMDMGDVNVHYNSPKPAQLNALAFAQGNDIHVGSGQEQHLPHEAWHVVQQRQGRVQATKQMKGGVPVNDDSSLEHEADVMGAKALQMYSLAPVLQAYNPINHVAQLMPVQFEGEEDIDSGQRSDVVDANQNEGEGWGSWMYRGVAGTLSSGRDMAVNAASTTGRVLYNTAAVSALAGHSAYNYVSSKGLSGMKEDVVGAGRSAVNYVSERGVTGIAEDVGHAGRTAVNYVSTRGVGGIFEDAKTVGHSALNYLNSAPDKVDEITSGVGWDIVKGVLKKELETLKNSGYQEIINPLLKAGDAFVVRAATNYIGAAALTALGATIGAIIAPILAVLAAFKTALTVWDHLTDNIKTGLLYILGLITAKLPRTAYLQELIVKGGKGEIRESVEAWIGDAEGWLASAKKYISTPVSSAYSMIVGDQSSHLPADPKAATSNEGNKKEGEMISINHPVLKLHVNNLKLGYENEKTPQKEDKAHEGDKQEKGKPGMIVEFFVQLHLFGQDIPERGSDAKDRLFVPFAGQIIYEAGSPIILIKGEKSLLGNSIEDVNISPLKVEGSVIKNAKLNIGEIKIGNDFLILTGASVELNNKLVTLKTNAKLNVAGFHAAGGVKLELNDGKFQSLEIEKASGGGDFELVHFKIDNVYNGNAEIHKSKIDLFNGVLSANNVNAKGSVENKTIKKFDFTVGDFKLDAFGSNVKVTGAELHYSGKNEEEKIDANLTGKAKEIDADIAGAVINLKELDIDKNEKTGKFKSGTIIIDGFTVNVLDASIIGTVIKINKATISHSEYALQGEVNDFEWNKDGVDFKNINVSMPGKKINPIDQLELSKMSLTITKDGGYKFILTSDIVVSPDGGTPVVGVEGAKLTVSKEGIDGEIEKITLNTSLFKIDINKALLSKEKFGAAKARIDLTSKEGDPEKSGLNSTFDTGLLDYLNLGGLSLTATDVYFIKGKGFSIGNISTNIPKFTVDLFGVKATVDPEERSIAVNSSITLPGEVPGVWPFSLSVPFPIFIGVAGQFGLELGGGVTLSLDAKASKEKGKNMPYKFETHPEIKGNLHLKISAGLELGARLLVALQANLYAQAMAVINAKANLTGSMLYMGGIKFEAAEPLNITYVLESSITAEVGGELKVKAFMFYDKQLKKVKFKDWNLGHWSKEGQIGSSATGEKIENGKAGKFGSNPIGPDTEEEIIEGAEAKKLLMDANTRIIGSGEEREKVLKGLTLEVKGLASQLLTKYTSLKQGFDKKMNDLMEVILMKDAYFMKNYSVSGVQQKLDAFDQKHKLDEKRELIRNEGNRLDQYEKELDNILKLMNNVEAALDRSRLEGGTEGEYEKISSEKEKLNAIDAFAGSVSATESNHAEMKTELQRMGAEALTFQVSSAVMTKDKFIEVSASTSWFGGDRKNIVPVDNALGAFDSVRESDKATQKTALEKVLHEINTYSGLFAISGRMSAVKLLQYQVETALRKLEK